MAIIKTFVFILCCIGFVGFCFSISLYMIEVKFNEGWSILFSLLQNKIHSLLFFQKMIWAVLASSVLVLFLSWIKSIYRTFSLMVAYGKGNRTVNIFYQSIINTIKRLLGLVFFFSIMIGSLVNINKINNINYRILLLWFLFCFVVAFFLIFAKKIFYIQWDSLIKLTNQ